MISVISTRQYCREDISKIENYDKAVLDIDEVWEVHHRLEIQNDYTLSVDELKSMGMYYNRPACELIFLTKLDHIRIHKFSSEIASRGGRNGVGESKVRCRGLYWWTDGVHNKYAKESPGEGWRRGKTNRKIASKSGKIAKAKKGAK